MEGNETVVAHWRLCWRLQGNENLQRVMPSRNGFSITNFNASFNPPLPFVHAICNGV